MAKKRKFADGGVLSTEGAKKAGEDAGRAAKTTNLRKYLVGQVEDANKRKSRMDVLDKGGWDALRTLDRQTQALEDTGKAERAKFMDSMGAYKKGGAVRGDGKAVRGRTKGRFV